MTAPAIAVLGVPLADGGADLLADASLVAGGRDALRRFAPDGARTVAFGGDLRPALDALEGADGPAVVLASGDPGFFGIVRVLAERFGPGRLDVRPAPSSVALAFARLGVPWDDAVVVSAHGRAPERALHTMLAAPKVAVLTSPGAPARWFVERLAGSGRTMAVAQRLGTTEEQVEQGMPEALAGRDFAEPNVVISLDRSPAARAASWPPRAPAAWALPEHAFAHRAGMITKAEVRALALARLGPGAGDLVWDVGCGSGSVAVECARLGAAAIAIDDDPGAIAVTRANAERHGAAVRTVTGRAPDALEGLPVPDAAFVGGGGEEVAAILAACAARARRVVVATLALAERVGPAFDALAGAGLAVEGTQLSASRLRPLPGGHRLAAINPVFIIWGTRP